MFQHRGIRIARYSQHFVEVLPMHLSPVDYLQGLHKSEKYQDLRNLLGSFGLGGHAHTIPISSLSGGQKARVVFASIR